MVDAPEQFGEFASLSLIHSRQSAGRLEMRFCAWRFLGLLAASTLSIGDSVSTAGPAGESGWREIVELTRESESPEGVLQEFEEAMATALRAGSAEMSEIVLAAAERLEQLAGAGAPKNELHRVALRSKSQIALVASRSVRALNKLSDEAIQRLRLTDAPPQCFRYVLRRRAESVLAMSQTGRWACRLIDEQFNSVLSGG